MLARKELMKSKYSYISHVYNFHLKIDKDGLHNYFEQIYLIIIKNVCRKSKTFVLFYQDS